MRKRKEYGCFHRIQAYLSLRLKWRCELDRGQRAGEESTNISFSIFSTRIPVRPTVSISYVSMLFVPLKSIDHSHPYRIRFIYSAPPLLPIFVVCLIAISHSFPRGQVKSLLTIVFCSTCTNVSIHTETRTSTVTFR